MVAYFKSDYTFCTTREENGQHVNKIWPHKLALSGGSCGPQLCMCWLRGVWGTSCTHYTHTEQLHMVGSCLFVNKLAGLLWGRPEQADEQCITM